MPIETTTWGEVTVGHIVRDQKDRLHTVVDERAQWLRLVGARDGAVSSVIRPPADQAVDIYVPTEQEAINLLVEELGARHLRIIEEREHSLARAQRWRMEPIAANANALRDHLDWIHQVNVDDVLRRWKGTEVNPSTKKTRKEALDELRAAHDAAHEDVETFPQFYPHIHTLEKKEA